LNYQKVSKKVPVLTNVLKLVAMDEADLEVMSACVQDSLVKTGELRFDPKAKRFLLPVNRFVWESEPRAKGQPAERRRAVLHFDRVTAVKTSGLDRSKPDTVLSLLALRFLPDESPSGKLELIFASDISVLLDIECIEAQLADVGGRWAAQSKPRHGV
jgi:Protein of unknown function (DUF2948)